MHTIENVTAYNHVEPGEAACFEVHATVTVGHPGIEPVLVEPKIRHKGGWEVLELQLLETGGISLQVVTEKEVSFKREGGTSWTMLEIIQPGGVSKKVQINQHKPIGCIDQIQSDV